MDYRIEIRGILYPSVSQSHLKIHEEARELCAQLGAQEYFIVSLIVEGVSNPYYVGEEEEEVLTTKRQYLTRIN